jgi:hypothetical protein
MAGKLINVVPRTVFDFGNTDSALTPQYLRIGDTIDVAEFGMIGLIVRVHQVAMAGSNAIIIGVFDDGFLDGSGFAFPNNEAFSDLSVEVFASPAPPYVRFSSSIVYGSHVAVALQPVNSGQPGLSATLSIDAYLRNADAT